MGSSGSAKENVKLNGVLVGRRGHTNFSGAGVSSITDDAANDELDIDVSGGGAHPDLATHDALGLATDAELATHAGAADPHTGYRLESATIGTADLTNDGVTYAKIQNVSATDRLLGRDTAGAGDVEELTVSGGVEFTGTGVQRSALTGDVTASAGSNATTIANDAVTYAKMQNVSATDRFLGRDTAGAGDVEELTPTAVSAMLSAEALTGVQVLVRKTAAQGPISSDTTLSNDDHLILPVVANGVYSITLELLITSANATMDFKTGWDVPAGTTFRYGFGNDWNGLASPFALATASGSGAGSVSGTWGLIVKGVFLVGGTAGNITFQWAQLTSDAGNLTVEANSILKGLRIA